MSDSAIRILNFDDSVTAQAGLISRYNPEIIDLKGIGPSARLWMDSRTRSAIEGRLGGRAEKSITFTGSGDFHHLSELLISRFDRPLSVIIFDFHPDWFTLPPRLACGSWLNRILENKNILKCVLIGVSSEDLCVWGLETGNLASLKDNRVEVYPHQHSPSTVFLKKVPGNVSFTAQRGFLHSTIHWSQLKDKKIEEFFPGIIKRLPTKEVYVSIDKDCLKKEFALTNWEEGFLSLDELLLMLNIIKRGLDIAAVDITGDYSPIRVKGWLKNLISRMDHPKDIPAESYSQPAVTGLNESTNLKIIETFRQQ